MSMTTYEITTLVFQSIISVVAFATFIVYYYQLRVMANQLKAMQDSSRAGSSLSLVTYLQAPEVRAARHCVREILSKKHFNDWTDEERKSAALVIANYDIAAALIKAGLAPAELVATNWGPSIKHCYEILKPFINEHRVMAGADSSYWSNFEWLYMEATRQVNATKVS